MADEIISDADLATIAASPALVKNDKVEVRAHSLADVLATKKYSDQIKAKRRGPFIVTRAIMPDAVGPLSSDSGDS